MIDVEVPKIAKKPIVVYDTWQFGGWIKPLMIDTEHVSADFLETLGKQGVMISNKAGSINLNEIADDTVRYLTDGIAKYDKYDYSIIECLLADGTEIEFPDYTNFDGLRARPVLEIKNTAFQNIRFTGDFKMNNLEVVNDYEFQNSQFTGDFNCPNLLEVGNVAFLYSVFTGDFECQNLQEVGEYAFRNSNFTGDFNCPNLQEVGEYAFFLSEFTGSFNCQNLDTVGDGAFELSIFTGEFNCPNLQEVGEYAFANSQFTGSFNCQNLDTVGDGAFANSLFDGTFECPNLQTIGDRAFLYSIFDTITIGANATLGTGCIGAHSTEFIQDYADNGKQAGTYVWDGTHWIYQT
jgi:hypothetical protein